MKKQRIVLFLMVAFSCSLLAQQTSVQTLYKGTVQPSFQVQTSTGAGTVYAADPGSLGIWNWTIAFGGAPTGTSTNLEGSNDFAILNDGAISSSSTTFTSATAGFKATDIGKEVRIACAGAAGATLVTTISGYTNSTTVTLAASASTTVTSALFNIGRWFQLDNSTVSTSAPVLGSTSMEMRGVAYKTAGFVRCNLITLSGGSSPSATCGIRAF